MSNTIKFGGQRACGQNARTHRRYADGSCPIPEPVSRLLQACERWPGLLVELQELK